MKCFISSENTFVGKYKRAIEMEKHQKRLEEIKNGRGSIDNRPIIQKNTFNRLKYKSESAKYKLIEHQKNNLLLFHRLNTIKQNPSITFSYIFPKSPSNVDLNSLRKRIKKTQRKKKKKRIETENNITKKHISEMKASDDIRLDLLKSHWRKHLNHIKILKSSRKRERMNPSHVKEVMQKVSNNIIRKSNSGPLHINTSPSKQKKTFNIPKINTSNINKNGKTNANDNKSITTSRMRGSKSARRSIMSRSSILAATQQQVIQHSKYLSKKTKQEKDKDIKLLNVYLDTSFAQPKSTTKLNIKSPSARDSYLYKVKR